jgi:hypothetical protein
MAGMGLLCVGLFVVASRSHNPVLFVPAVVSVGGLYLGWRSFRQIQRGTMVLQAVAQVDWGYPVRAEVEINNLLEGVRRRWMIVVPPAEALLEEILEDLEAKRRPQELRELFAQQVFVQGGPRRAARHRAGPNSDTRFYAVFFSVLGLTLLALGLHVCLVVFTADPSDRLSRLIESVSSMWQLGFGAVVGLLGGRTLKG